MEYEKRYKEALKRAKEKRDEYKRLDGEESFVPSDIEYIFPELAESEDERIRKEIQSVIKQLDKDTTICGKKYDYNQWIAWLEKQGKKSNIHQDAEDDLRRQSTIRILEYARSLDAYNQYGKESINKDISWLEKQGEPQPYQGNADTMRKNLIKAFKSVSGNHWGGFDVRDIIHFLESKDAIELEKHGEQKPIDKVGPKFKVGDWVLQENIGVYKVIEICKSWYEVIDFKDNHYSISFDDEYMCHFWTIQDAKDGDVFVAEIDEEPNDFIYIFKEYNQNLGFWSHCYLDAYTNKFHKGIYHNNLNVGVPATKEQRDLLFKKMHEAGYEWDAEKKELKKIEKNPAWSEEDEVGLGVVMWAIEQARSIVKDENDMGNLWYAERWLKSIKERMKGE